MITIELQVHLRLYSLSFCSFFGYLILLNLFLAILLDNFDEPPGAEEEEEDEDNEPKVPIMKRIKNFCCFCIKNKEEI